MAEIKAADVAKLRNITGAGMMDCKEALANSDGNFDTAIEFLRKKGQKVASKRIDREASEGCVLASISADGKCGAIVVLNCETDFVAKNQDYVAFTKALLTVAIDKNPASLEELLSLSVNNIKISDAITEKIGTIGEKLALSYYEKVEAEQVFAYIHPGNKLATLVGFNKKVSDLQIGKDVAMQIAAMNPVAIDKDFVKPETIAQEIEIGKEQARRDGKPEEMLEKIAQGKLSKFFKESTLLNQDFVKDNKITIRQYLQSVNKELTVTEFKRFTLNL